MASSSIHFHDLPLELLHMVFAYFIVVTDYGGFGEYDPVIFDAAHVCRYWLEVASTVIFRSAPMRMVTFDERHDRVFLRINIAWLGMIRRLCLEIRTHQKRMEEIYA